MRLTFFILCLLLTAALLGCSKPWTNPDIKNPKLAEYQFDKDSTDCNVIAGEKYPLSKDQQLPIYNKCMEDRGWTLRQKGDGIPLNK